MKKQAKLQVIEKYRQYRTIEDDIFGYHHIYRFPNVYGASVILGEGSHGLECAEIYFDDDPKSTERFMIGETHDYIDYKKLEKILDDLFNKEK